jgi:hypothetical protein
LLPAGEEIQYLFPATSSVLPATTMTHVLVAVTARRITVINTGFFSRIRPRAVVASYPRDTRLGPVDTNATPYFQLGHTMYEIDDEYIAVVNAADAEIASADPLPPDPLPDR